MTCAAQQPLFARNLTERLWEISILLLPMVALVFACQSVGATGFGFHRHMQSTSDRSTGTSYRVGDTRYYNEPGLNMHSQRFGGTTYHRGQNYDRGSSFSGTSYRAGNVTYHHGYDDRSNSRYSGSSQRIGNVTYHNSYDSQSGSRFSGSSQRVGNTTYHNSYDSRTGERRYGSTQNIGNFRFHTRW